MVCHQTKRFPKGAISCLSKQDLYHAIMKVVIVKLILTNTNSTNDSIEVYEASRVDHSSNRAAAASS